MPSNADKSGGGIKGVRRTTKKRSARTKTVAGPVEDIEPVVSTTPPSTTGFLTVGGVRSADITSFIRQLIMLLEAGTPILKSLKSLAERGPRAGIRALVSDISQYVEAGNPVWQAFERHPRYFDTVFVNTVKASEASGTLVTVLRRMVDYRERREILIKRVRGAMVYPVILLFVCVGVLLLMAKFVIPSLEQMFDRLDVELPTYTVRFIAVVNHLGARWWVYLLILIGLIVLYKLWWVRNPLRRLTADRIKLRIPIVGPILRKHAIVEFTRTFSLLLRSGLPMMATLELVRNAIKNQAVAYTLQDMRDSVERGAGLEEPLRDAQRVIPPVVADLLVTGEESGQLDAISDQIADTYEEEVTISINALGELLTPVLTIFIGIMVCLLALALFRPLIDMVSQLAAAGGG